MHCARPLQWASGSLLVLAVLYLAFWPVAVDPVAWTAPRDLGFVVPFEANDQLRYARAYDIGPYSGPEDITSGIDGHLYSTSAEGLILRYDASGQVSVFADTGGRPLGIETDADGSLVVANAYLGLQRIARDGVVQTLLQAIDGRPLVSANELAIAADGKIYFSESSSKFGAAQSGGTFAASRLDLIEHGAHGQVLVHDPASGSTRVLLDGLNYANGVAISEDQTFLLIAETGAYRILKFWLSGPNVGHSEVLLENLPAFPDNINSGRNGRFWIGLVAPRNAFIDRFSQRPWLRKMLMRLPEPLWPDAVPHSQVIAINANGEVLMNLHDDAAHYPALTGALETRDSIYFSSLFGNQLPFVRKQDL